MSLPRVSLYTSYLNPTDKLHNCDVMIREDITIDEFIDVLIGKLS